MNTPPATPERLAPSRLLGLDRRGWPGTIVVAIAIVAIAIGLPVVNALVSAGRPLAAGTELDAGHGVRLRVPEGWQLTSRREAAASSVTIQRGSTTLQIRSSPSRGGLDEEYDRVADGIRDGRGVQLLSDPTTFVTTSGLVGQRGSYAGPTTEGRFLVLVGGGTTIVATVKAPSGELRGGIDAANQVLRTLRWEPS
jgi:hypothetical protein